MKLYWNFYPSRDILSLVRNKKQRKIMFWLAIGSVILFLGLMVEFVIYRYTTNRSVMFKTEDGSLQIYRDRKWQDFIAAGAVINTGKTGYSADTGITKDEYKRWFRELTALDTNVVRVNGIQPPAFYQAFFEYNMLTNKPLYLLHGIYIEDYNVEYYKDAYADQLLTDYFEEIRRTVDVIHGSAVIKARIGYASGTYNMNISPYVMGFALGREMDSDFIAVTNEKNTQVIGFEGDYLYTENATPYEAWLAGTGNYVISYEQDKYRGSYKLINLGDVNLNHLRTTEKFNAKIYVSRDDFPVFPELAGFKNN